MLPQSWKYEEVHGWYFAAHADARVVPLKAQDGTNLGWALSVLAHLTPEGDSRPVDVIGLSCGPEPEEEEIDRLFYGRDREGYHRRGGFEGEWIAVVATPSVERVYLGPMSSVMYHRDFRTVATSHNLIPSLRRDVELSRAVDPLATDRYYAFGLTAFEGVRRLLPNHCLDLNTFEPVRHWPKAPLPVFTDPQDGVRRAVQHSRRVVAVLADQPLRVSLTAGQDSRAVLSLLKPFVATSDVLAYTAKAKAKHIRTDLYWAKEVAARVGIRHQVGRAEKGAEEDVPALFARLGEARAGALLTIPHRGSSDWIGLNGLVGELARAYFWKHQDSAQARVSVSTLLRHTKQPDHPGVEAAADRWYKSLPSFVRGDFALCMDLLYLEQRLGCWAFPSSYFKDFSTGGYNPFSGPHNVEVALRLPLGYRAAGSFQRDVVLHAWPDLALLPYNEPVGWDLLEQRLRKAKADARLSLGALRRQIMPMS